MHSNIFNHFLRYEKSIFSQNYHFCKRTIKVIKLHIYWLIQFSWCSKHFNYELYLNYKSENPSFWCVGPICLGNFFLSFAFFDSQWLNSKKYEIFFKSVSFLIYFFTSFFTNNFSIFIHVVFGKRTHENVCCLIYHDFTQYELKIFVKVQNTSFLFTFFLRFLKDPNFPLSTLSSNRPKFPEIRP